MKISEILRSAANTIFEKNGQIGFSIYAIGDPNRIKASAYFWDLFDHPLGIFLEPAQN